MKRMMFVGLIVLATNFMGCTKVDPDKEVKSIAMQKCMDKIRDEFGQDSISFHTLSAIEIMNHNPNSNVSIIDFDRKNSQGIEVTHRASCIDTAGEAPFMTMNPPIN